MSDTKSSVQAAVKAARAESNAAIAAHDDFKVSALVDREVIVVTGSGAAIESRKNLRATFVQQFRESADLIYIRTPEKIEVSDDLTQVSEIGHWTGSWTTAGQKVNAQGTYSAIWHKVADKWLARAELFVTL
jgi:ketosteroid isomerase-like protein